MQHSTLVLALKEAFLELSAAQPGFFRYPGRGNWFGDGARWRGDAGIEVCARQVAFRPDGRIQDAARHVGPSTLPTDSVVRIPAARRVSRPRDSAVREMPWILEAVVIVRTGVPGRFSRIRSAAKSFR